MKKKNDFCCFFFKTIYVIYKVLFHGKITVYKITFEKRISFFYETLILIFLLSDQQFKKYIKFKSVEKRIRTATQKRMNL